MNGCYNGCWHDHCTLNSGFLRKGKTTCAPHTHTQNKIPLLLRSVWICLRFACIYLRFACIHAPDCLSSRFQFTTTISNHSHSLIVFGDTQPQVKQCALQGFESTACLFPSICLVSTLWLSGPAGIIDHPSAHYHTEWRSHSSYETQDDPEHRISVLGLISCPVHQRGFCTFHCLLSTDEDAHPVKKKKKKLYDARPTTPSVPIFHSLGILQSQEMEG